MLKKIPGCGFLYETLQQPTTASEAMKHRGIYKALHSAMLNHTLRRVVVNVGLSLIRNYPKICWIW